MTDRNPFPDAQATQMCPESTSLTPAGLEIPDAYLENRCNSSNSIAIFPGYASFPPPYLL